MLTIWGRRTSSNVQALMWCVGELALEFQRHDAGHRFGLLDTDEFRKLNPNGTIPVIQDGPNPSLWETGPILRYLASMYGADDFWPRDPTRQAEVDKWAEWAKINVAMAFTVPVFWRVVRTPQIERDHQAIETAVTALENTLAIADAQLSENAFLCGSCLTLADIQLGHILYRYYDIDISRASLPNLRRYYEGLTDRTAYQTHVMINYDELRAN
ncbi:glutathione S-transferase [Ruegeria sp. HKCCE3926]|uniref:glutathione S-transferase family protein n=1 Tax=Ruegeria sp. HKCCE3926 TaxID=2794831 RepID=UPI001AE54312|nr:glutathione S-transferase [Ruegeria sp. HKCCE3926]